MTFTSVNPHDPADVIGEWDAADEREVADVIERARRAAQTWRRAPAAVRSKALGDAAAAVEQRAAEITALTVREVGKPVSEARGEVARADPILRYYAQLALLPDGETLPAADPDALLMTRHRPVGVAAAARRPPAR
jgi:aldehyde dehydrogenase (NAD+)